MRKFLVTLFILVILGAAGFFFGWAQFAVPPGSYGIITSKTYGVDPTPVRSGEFRWVWFKLIPTNVKIPVFHLEQEKFTINFNSSLPSGDSYAAFAGMPADFSWELKASLSFSIKPESLASLVELHNITSQEDLRNFMQDIAKNAEIIILRNMASWETDSVRLEKILSGSQDMELEREILKRFPEICDFSFVVQTAKFPDFILYRQVRLLYEEFLSKQREYVSSSFGKRAEYHIEAQLRFDELERYGEMLTKYPVLLEYLLLEKQIKE